MNKKESETSILIVDDDKATIEMLSMLLRRRGFDVGTAGNGNEALEFIKQRSFDIIISDLRMPNLDGYELLDIVNTSFRGHKVMVMTADMFTRERLLRRGALEAFAKPFNLNDFIEDLRVLLKERRRTKRFLSKEDVRCTVKNGADTVLAKGRLCDISIDGALIDLDDDMAEAKDVVLQLALTDESETFTTVKGTVLRKGRRETGRPMQLAVYFEDQRDLRLLENMESHIQLKSAPYLV